MARAEVFHQWVLYAIICGVVVWGGCGTAVQQENESGPGRLLRAYGRLPAAAKESFAATGSLDAWVAAREARGACVVRFYERDGSYYLTQQRHNLRPWRQELRVTADEPEGKLSWHLKGKKFSKAAQRGAGQGRLQAREAAIIRDLLAAPVSLCSAGERGTLNIDEQVQIEGRWYRPITAAGPLPGTERIFYQDMEAQRVEMVKLVGDDGVNLLGRAYNFGEMKAVPVLLPEKIEIFQAGPDLEPGPRLLQIDYYSFAVLGKRD